jgi:hypothetical protein
MSNTTLTADIVAKEALMILENELGFMKEIHRAHEDEFGKEVNGYKVGSTIRIRRPADFTVRTGAVMDVQDVIEGRLTMAVDRQVGVDFQFTSADLTLSVSDLSERVIKPAMSSLINHVAADVLDTFYKGVYNWVGTPTVASTGVGINSFADFYKGVQRMNEMAVPTSDRTAVLSPEDEGALLSNAVTLNNNGINSEAYRNGNVGMIGGVKTMMSQVIPTFTSSAADGTTPLVDGTASVNTVSYDTAKNTWTQTLVTDGWDPTSTAIPVGTVFTIADVFMVNPKTKASTGILQQFVVVTAATTNASAGSDTELTISPPLITSGPHQTVTITGDINDNAIVLTAAASTAYKQNIMFHKNAMGMAVVPLEMPQGAVNASRQSYKGLSVRVIPVYDGVNDVSKWRLDMLYGRTVLDPRLAVRVSGTT